MKTHRIHHEIGDDDPVTLAEACELFFNGRLKPSTLRTECKRGNLVIERIGNKDFVTLNAIRDMRERCRIRRTPEGETAGTNRESQSEPSAQDALRAKAEALKKERP